MIDACLRDHLICEFIADPTVVNDVHETVPTPFQGNSDLADPAVNIQPENVEKKIATLVPAVFIEVLKAVVNPQRTADPDADILLKFFQC